MSGIHVRYQITHCIICGEKLGGNGSRYSGHVVLEDEKVGVGWCNKCDDVKQEQDNERPYNRGCYGKWQPRYGLAVEVTEYRDPETKYTVVPIVNTKGRAIKK